MLTQRLTVDESTMAGTLTISAEPSALAELMGLAGELRLRMNITTEGTLHVNLPLPELPGEVE